MYLQQVALQDKAKESSDVESRGVMSGDTLLQKSAAAEAHSSEPVCLLLRPHASRAGKLADMNAQ